MGIRFLVINTLGAYVKVVIIIASVVIGVVVLAFIALTLFLSFQSRKQPPSYGKIEEKYYVCRQQKLLEGGVFGKGPMRKFPEDNSEFWCYRDDWEEIDKNTFKGLATDWYAVNWASDTPFWRASK